MDWYELTILYIAKVQMTRRSSPEDLLGLKYTTVKQSECTYGFAYCKLCIRITSWLQAKRDFEIL